MLDNGYLIVEKYENLYEKYKERYQLTHDLYAIPRIDRSPEDYHIQYRGIDRDCLEPNEITPRNLAEIRLSEIVEEWKSKNRDDYYTCFMYQEDFIPVELLDEIFSLLEEDRQKFETIFVRKAGIKSLVPKNFISIGYEPSYFYSDHFSASCDCMLIPRWHGTDEEGVLFKEYFDQLNKYGLFASFKLCDEFLNYYLSFDWTERGDFYTTEIFINESHLTS